MEGTWISLCEDLVFIILFNFLFITSVDKLKEQTFFPLSFISICMSKMNRKYVHMFSSSQISLVNFQSSDYTIDSVGSWPWLMFGQSWTRWSWRSFPAPVIPPFHGFCCFSTQVAVSSICSNIVFVTNTEIVTQVLTQHRASSKTWVFSKKSPNKPNQWNQLVSLYLPTAFYHIFSFAPAHKHW